MNNRRRTAGFGLWIALLAFVLIFIVVSEGWNMLKPNEYSYVTFQQDVTGRANEIEEVIISPNRETPTGMVTVVWKNEEENSFYVTDVREVRAWLESVSYENYEETDVINREGWFYRNGTSMVHYDKGK